MSTTFYMGLDHRKEIAWRANNGEVTFKVLRRQLDGCPCCGVVIANDQKAFTDEYGNTFTRDELLAELGWK